MQTPEQFTAESGLEFKFEFVPQSQSRNKNSDPCINWKVTVSKGSACLTVEYMQGAGYMPGYKPTGRKTIDDADREKAFSETGRHGLKRVLEPTPTDVLHGLVLDYSAIDYANFEEWANEYGFDSDSIKALAIYDQCISVALQLRQMIDLDAAREAFQDY